jgi:glutamate 5-kinase
LIGFGVVPIVNENDTVSTAELESSEPQTRVIAFGDNDRLAALVMSGLDADALVLLTNVDGLLKENPPEKSIARGKSPALGLIPLVSEVTPELRALGSGASPGGRGGMRTKLESAEIAMKCGGIAVIANGRHPDTIRRIFKGEKIGTSFLSEKRMRGKRRWIAFAAGVQGRIVVDSGAHRAITESKASLLVSGVMRIEGSFSKKDVVSLLDSAGHEFARGIASRASDEIETLRKKPFSGSKRLLRSGSGQVLVGRDDIVVLGQ